MGQMAIDLTKDLDPKNRDEKQANREAAIDIDIKDQYLGTPGCSTTPTPANVPSCRC